VVLYNSQRHYIFLAIEIKNSTRSVADPDLELKRGEGEGTGAVLFCLPSLLFFPLWFLLFSPKIRGGGGGAFPRSAIGAVKAIKVVVAEQLL